MGSLFSRFKKKKSALEVLENLEEEIQGIEHDRQTTMLKQKKYIGRLIVYSILLYFLLAITFYFLCFPSTLRDGAIYITPLVLIPVLVMGARRFLNWHFRKEMIKSKDKLADLRAKKKKILDEVMDNETFRVAKEILEKYAPDQLGKKPLGLSDEKKLLEQKALFVKEALPEGKKNENVKPSEPGRENKTGSPRKEPIALPPAMPNMATLVHSQGPPPISQAVSQPLLQTSISTRRQLPRPIMAPQASRGFMDRLIELLVGDGPTNRYALICLNCSSHNGMALKEEFEYLPFRCAYCGYPNPSRKVKQKKIVTAMAEESVTSDEKAGEIFGQLSNQGSNSRAATMKTEMRLRNPPNNRSLADVSATSISITKTPVPRIYFKSLFENPITDSATSGSENILKKFEMSLKKSPSSSIANVPETSEAQINSPKDDFTSKCCEACGLKRSNLHFYNSSNICINCLPQKYTKKLTSEVSNLICHVCNTKKKFDKSDNVCDCTHLSPIEVCSENFNYKDVCKKCGKEKNFDNLIDTCECTFSPPKKSIMEKKPGEVPSKWCVICDIKKRFGNLTDICDQCMPSPKKTVLLNDTNEITHKSCMICRIKNRFDNLTNVCDECITHFFIEKNFPTSDI